MNVLTWNGAVLRLDAVRRRLVQDPVWMTAADGGDFLLDRLSPVQSGVAPEGLETLPGHLAGTIRIAGAAGFLSAQPSKRDLIFEPEDGSVMQSFLLLRPEDLADIRHILSHRWRVRPSHLLLEKADIKLVSGFALELGAIRLDLPSALPLTSFTRRADDGGYAAPPSFVLRPGDDYAESIELADLVTQKGPALSFPLAGNRPSRAPEVETRETFREVGSARWTLPQTRRLATAPLVGRERDAALFAASAEMQPQPAMGLIRSCSCAASSERVYPSGRRLRGAGLRRGRHRSRPLPFGHHALPARRACLWRRSGLGGARRAAPCPEAGGHAGRVLGGMAGQLRTLADGCDAGAGHAQPCDAARNQAASAGRTGRGCRFRSPRDHADAGLW